MNTVPAWFPQVVKSGCGLWFEGANSRSLPSALRAPVGMTTKKRRMRFAHFIHLPKPARYVASVHRPRLSANRIGSVWWGVEPIDT